MTTCYKTLIALLALGRIAQGQDPTPGVDLPTDARASIATAGARYVGIPVLRSTPMLGFGLGAVGAVTGRLDSASSPSVLGAGGAFSQTRSWIFAVGSRVFFHADARRGAAGVSFFDFRYDFFGVGVDQANAHQSIDVSQRGDAEMIDMLGRLMGKLYVGPRYLHRGVVVTLESADSASPVAAVARQDQDYQLSAIGLQAEYDTRDRSEAPRHGTEAELSVLFARDWLGTTDPHNSYRGWINHYVALPSNSVLAFRVTGCSVDAGAPIWELCLYGINADLRGYAGGRYRDRTMFTTQAELRVPLAQRFGANLFGGVGTVTPSISAIAMDDVLPSAGVGLQYLVSTAYHLNVGGDVAWGKNGAAFYLRLGQAF
ncbi:MAG TPA: BamA/TamA family outer membrane protein [Casimicrobiaceae bacterium]